MKAIITVVGKDQVGIISKVSTLLAQEDVNVLDINQSIMSDYYNMFMKVNLNDQSKDYQSIQSKLQKLG